MIEPALFEDIKVDGDKAEISQRMAIVDLDGATEKVNVNFLEIDFASFIAPNIIEGRTVQTDNEVVVDESLKTQYEATLGSQLTIRDNDTALTIVGFTDKAKLSVSPVVYMNSDTYGQLAVVPLKDPSKQMINGIVTKGELVSYPEEDLEVYDIQSFINELPGYGAQNLTFGFMIIFLIIIAAIVIGIFMYILTMQKQTIFGVMKAEGISTWFIAKSVIWQTFILATIGIALGVLLTYMTGFFLPKAVPFMLNHWFVAIVSVSMLLIALLGSLFSVRSIAKIDPLEAIG